LPRVFKIFSAVKRKEKKVEVEGDVVKRGKSVAFSESVARCEGKVSASASVTKMVIPRSTKGAEANIGSRKSKL